MARFFEISRLTQGPRIFASLALILVAAQARATSYEITSTVDEYTVNGVCSLREAIHAAVADVAVDTCPAGSQDDTIHLAGGVYEFSLGEVIVDTPGSLGVSGDGATVTIDLGGHNRFLDIAPGATVALTNLHVVNGAEIAGGALLSVESNLSLYGVAFENNYASFEGGALYFYSSTGTALQVDQSGFFGNQADMEGGAAYLWVSGASSIRLRDVQAVSNTSVRAGAFEISASNGGQASCSRCEFQDNTAESGAGVLLGGYGAGTSTSLTDGSFILNESTSGEYRSPVSVWLQANQGAVVSVDRIVSTDALAAANPAVDVFLQAWNGAIVRVTNALLVRSSFDGLVGEAFDLGQIEISHTTIADHATGATLVSSTGGTLRLGNSLVTSNGVDLLVTPQGVELLENFIGGDPLFSDWPLYHLSPGSPAIDACDSPGVPFRLADLDHLPRVQGSAPDCGAFETGAGLFADGFETADSGSWSSTSVASPRAMVDRARNRP